MSLIYFIHGTTFRPTLLLASELVEAALSGSGCEPFSAASFCTNHGGRVSISSGPSGPVSFLVLVNLRSGIKLSYADSTGAPSNAAEAK